MVTVSFKMNVQDKLFHHLLQTRFHLENYIAEGNDNIDDELIWHYSRYGLNPITLMLPVN